jgi:hypothetical protein
VFCKGVRLEKTIHMGSSCALCFHIFAIQGRKVEVRGCIGDLRILVIDAEHIVNDNSGLVEKQARDARRALPAFIFVTWNQEVEKVTDVRLGGVNRALGLDRFGVRKTGSARVRVEHAVIPIVR